MRNTQESPILDRPKPILAGFLERHTLSEAEIIGEEIRVVGIDRFRDHPKISSRQITLVEMDDVVDWATEASKSGKVSALLHFNLRFILPLRERMPLHSSVVFMRT